MMMTSLQKLGVWMDEKWLEIDLLFDSIAKFHKSSIFESVNGEQQI